MSPKTETALVPAEQQALAIAEQQAALAAYAGAGTDDISNKFVRPPALALAQDTTPQKKRTNPGYIQGLVDGQLFNTLSGQIYGTGPLNFVVIKSLGHRNVLFDKEKMGVVVERDLPDSDPRTQFHDIKQPDGTIKSTKPEATQYHDYLVYLPDTAEVLTLSFKGTMIGTAIKLNSQIKYPIRIGDKTLANPPAFARAFKLGVAEESNPKNTWWVFTVTPDGLVDPTCETFKTLAELYRSYNAVEVEVTDAEVREVEAEDEEAPF